MDHEGHVCLSCLRFELRLPDGSAREVHLHRMNSYPLHHQIPPPHQIERSLGQIPRSATNASATNASAHMCFFATRRPSFEMPRRKPIHLRKEQANHVGLTHLGRPVCVKRNRIYAIHHLSTLKGGSPRYLAKKNTGVTLKQRE